MIISSANQLYNILEKALKQDQEKPTLQVWGEVLGAEPNNVEDVSNKIAELIGLLHDVKSDIVQLNSRNESRYLQAVSKIQSIILSKSFIDEQWKSIKGTISQETLNLIATCGELIEDKGKGQDTISQDKYQQLKQRVTSLIDDFLDSDIPKDIKFDLIGELKQIESALTNYHIRGEINLRKVSNEVFGNILLKCLRIPKMYREDAEKVLQVTLQINELIGAVEKAKYFPLIQIHYDSVEMFDPL